MEPKTIYHTDANKINFNFLRDSFVGSTFHPLCEIANEDQNEPMPIGGNLLNWSNNKMNLCPCEAT